MYLNIYGWKGPYLPNKKQSSNLIDIGTYADYVHLVMLTDNDPSWGDGNAVPAWWHHNTSYCLSGRNCNLWVQISLIDLSLVNALDLKIDGGDGGSNGQIKWFTSGSYTYMFVRTIAIRNPND